MTGVARAVGVARGVGVARAAGVARRLGVARVVGVGRGVGLGVAVGSGVTAGVGVPEGSEKVIGGSDKVGVAAGVEDCASAAGALVTSRRASERRAGETRVRRGTIMMRGASANAVEVNHFGCRTRRRCSYPRRSEVAMRRDRFAAIDVRGARRSLTRRHSCPISGLLPAFRDMGRRRAVPRTDRDAGYRTLEAAVSLTGSDVRPFAVLCAS